MSTVAVSSAAAVDAPKVRSIDEIEMLKKQLDELSEVVKQLYAMQTTKEATAPTAHQTQHPTTFVWPLETKTTTR